MTIQLLLCRTALWFAAVFTAAFALAGCASIEQTAGDTVAEFAAEADEPSALQHVVDEYLPVGDDARPLRVCLLVGALVELGTDKARLIEPERAADSLGRLFVLQVAAETARTADPLWREADMGNVVLAFAGALIEIGEEKVAGYIKRGLSIGAGLFAARQIGVDAIKGPALFRAVRDILAKVGSDEISLDDGWASCTQRIEKNRALLATVAGGA